MTAAQLTLDLRERKARRKAGPRLAARMMQILAARGRWTTRRELARFGLNDRQCRLGREWAHGRILQGQQGYKLLRDATPGEIEAAISSFRAQIEAESKQMGLLIRRAHESLHRRGVA